MNNHVHPVFAQILNEHGPKSVAAHTLAAAIDNAEIHAAKHDAHFGPVLREDDGSAIDAALRGPDKPKLRAEIERLERHHRGIAKLDLPDSQSGATLRQIAASIAKLKAHLAAAIVAGALVFAAAFPAGSPSTDATFPIAPHEAKQAPLTPSVMDDAWGLTSWS